MEPLKEPDPTFDALLELARQHEPDAEPRPGFDTRLRARIRELRVAGGEPAAAFPLFTRWLWSASWGLSPVAALLALLLALFYGFSLPEGAGTLVFHLADWIPGGGF